LTPLILITRTRSRQILKICKRSSLHAVVTALQSVVYVSCLISHGRSKWEEVGVDQGLREASAPNSTEFAVFFLIRFVCVSKGWSLPLSDRDHARLTVRTSIVPRILCKNLDTPFLHCTERSAPPGGLLFILSLHVVWTPDPTREEGSGE